MNKKIGNYTVKSNGKFRPLFSFYELSDKETSKLVNDYLGCFSDDKNEVLNHFSDCTFFKYKNQIYNLDEFIKLNCDSDLANICDAVTGLTYFNGIGIKLNKENDAVKVFYFYY